MAEENLGDSRVFEEHTISLERDGLSPRAASAVTINIQDGSPRREPEYTESLQDENVNLRRRLAESEFGFQRRLERQTDLISKLQDQLNDSKRRMADMDAAERTATIAVASLPSPARDVCKYRSAATTEVEEGLLNRLLEEQEKSTTLYDTNTTLRQEVEDIRSANFHLTSDLLRVTQLYDGVRQELNRQVDEYKKTEATYVAHLSAEHRQMLKMWRSLQQLRREYADTRSHATSGLSSMQADFQRLMRSATSACRQLSLRDAYIGTLRALEEAGLAQDLQSRLSAGANVEQLVWENIRRLRETHNQKDEEIRTLRVKRESTEMEIRRLEEQVHIFQRDKVDFNQERSSLMGQLERRNTELRDFEAQLASLRKDYMDADAQLKMATQKQQTLENQLEYIHRELTSEQQLRSTAQEERIHLVKEKTDLEQRVSSLLEQARSHEAARRQAEELLRDAREQLAEMRRDAKQRSDSAIDYENRNRELESRRMEMELQLKTLQKMLDISQETELDLKRQLEQTVAQKESSHGRLVELQRRCQELETEKKELIVIRIKLERDRTTLKQDLLACQNDRRRKDEFIRAAEAERAALDKAVSAIEKENTELHRAVTQLQGQVTKMEQAHSQRLSEITQRHQHDLETEVCQLRTEKQDAVRQSEHLEKIYKQKLRSLEQQIARLREQLREEVRRRQEYLTRALRQSHDVAQLRAGLDHSFASLRNDPILDPLLLPANHRYSASASHLVAGSRLRLATSAEETNIASTSEK